MNPLTITFNAEAVPAYQPFLIFDSNIDTTADNNNPGASWSATNKLKDNRGQIAFTLANEVRNPLVNINLSVEMLQSIITDNDQKIYLAVIMRSSVRINNLINELVKSQQVDELQPENGDA